MKTEPVKGFKDFTGEDAEKFAVIREMARQVFEKYNFEEVQTPVIEYEEFVRGEKEQEKDSAISEIFKLKDKGERALALRYEFTFQLKRIAQNKKLPYKRFQIGPVFRDEPVSENRFRQLTQCDIDIVGATIQDQAEILAVVKQILDALKIPSIIYVNNKKLLNEILDELKIKDKADVIREIDKLDKLTEKEVLENLKKLGSEKVLGVLKQKENFFKKYPAYAEIEQLKKICADYGIKIIFSPFLARGLSYYTGNIFEIKSTIKETICGGGTYEIDGTKSAGISFSIERLMAVAKILVNIERYLVVSLGENKKAIQLANQLRAKGKNVSVFYGKPSKALEYANSYKIKNVIFVGEQEVKKKIFMIKNMENGRQKRLIISKE